MKEENKTLKITAPEGYEIDKENSTFENIVFKPIEKKLSKTWEEFCETHPIQKVEFYIDRSSDLCYLEGGNRKTEVDKNLLPNKETAEAMLALCQLIQLRDSYNDGWKPDWNNVYENKHIIYSYKNEICISANAISSRILAFKTPELRDLFLVYFRDLIEIAKPLI